MAETQDISVEARASGAVIETVTSEAASESAPAKPRRGRPKGSVNKTNKIAKEAITEAAPHAFLIRIMEGRKFMRAAEDGAKRKVACYPTLQESTAAARTLLAKTCPDMKAVELAGKDGEPLVPINLAMTDKELARRVALILTRAEAEASIEGSAGTAHVPGSAEGEGAVVISGSPPSPSPSRGTKAAGNGAAKGSGGPLSDPGACISTQHPVSEFQNNFSKNAKPAEPKVGEEAVVGEHVFDGASRLVYPIKIRNLGPDRAGLPDKFVVIRAGVAVKHVGGDFDAALAWVREEFDLANVPVHFGAVGPEGPDLKRPDQRGPGWHRPDVARGYPERKS